MNLLEASQILEHPIRTLVGILLIGLSLRPHSRQNTNSEIESVQNGSGDCNSSIRGYDTQP
ncbi:MAG: hypothetical protein ACI8X5_003575 [Planctomycetota bacterium]|jgi:hypothetical protein